MNEIKCKSCRNENICKWCSDMKFKQEEIDKIPITRGLTPVIIKVECESYERKVTKQEEDLEVLGNNFEN